MQASVVICAYTLERWDELRAAVASVHAQTVAPRDVIVVVDGNEELLSLAREHLEQTVVAANDGAPGASGARATGARLARAEIVAYMDDDAIAEPGWLEALLSAYRDPDVLGTGGLVEPLWLTGRPAWLPAELDWVVGCTWAGWDARERRIRNAIAVNMSVRADVLTRVGAMPAELSRLERSGVVSGTAEETELCIRAARLHPGGYWCFVPEARVHHVVPAARTTWSYFVGRCRLEGTAKAILAGLAGAQDGLASERRYVRSVLPRALARELWAGVRGDADGLRRAGAIVVALAVTGWAYVLGRARLRRGAS